MGLNLKKFLLSSVVVGAFIFYSFHERNEEAEHVVLPHVANTISIPTVPPPTSGQEIAVTDTPVPTVQAGGQYKDGEYTGDVADAFYGFVQVKAVIKNGKVADVVFLQYPHDRRTSIEINSQAMPLLTQEAIQSQNAQVDVVSGATQTSEAFRQSLSSALDKAKA